MYVWIHRIKGEDGKFKFITDGDARRILFKNGMRVPPELEGTPVKVDLPGELNVSYGCDDTVVIINPLDHTLMPLSNALDISEEDESILRFRSYDGREQTMPLKEVVASAVRFD